MFIRRFCLLLEKIFPFRRSVWQDSLRCRSPVAYDRRRDLPRSLPGPAGKTVSGGAPLPAFRTDAAGRFPAAGAGLFQKPGNVTERSPYTGRGCPPETGAGKGAQRAEAPGGADIRKSGKTGEETVLSWYTCEVQEPKTGREGSGPDEKAGVPSSGCSGGSCRNGLSFFFCRAEEEGRRIRGARCGRKESCRKRQGGTGSLRMRHVHFVPVLHPDSGG